MGKKYIIELEDENYHQYSDSEPSDYLWRVKGFNALVFDEVGISKLTPYTEPDLEHVRMEAYEDGYKTAKVQCNIQAEKDMREVGERHYQRGLADAKCGYENGFENGMIVAWDAAKKIALMDTETSENVTGYFGLFRIMENLTPMQAIEKIRQYEQEQKEFHVGDEVELKCGVRPAIYMQGIKGSDEIYLLFNDGSCGVHSKSEIERKTGRHFPEIATILENMRGEQDG